MNKVNIAAVLAAALAVCLICPPAWSETGVSRNEILVGMSTVLVGPALFLGTNFRLGAEAYLAQVSETGGIHGRRIRLLVYDDGYEPNRAVVNANKLIKEDKVFCFLGNVGTPTAVAIKPILEQEQVPLFGPFTGAESIREPLSKYLFHYRASYNQEAEEFVHGMVDELGLREIAVFHQDDAYGRAVLGGTVKALAKRRLRPVATGTYTRNFENVQSALESLMAAKPQAVVMAGTYSACAKFITLWKRKYVMSGMKKDLAPVFMNVSFVGPDMLAELLGNYGDNVVVTQVVPPFLSSDGQYPAVDEYLSLMRRYYPNQKPSIVGLEGFLATKVFVEVLRRAGKDLTREGFIRAAEAVKGLDIQAGTIINFSASNHQGSNKIYPSVIKNRRFQIVKDWHDVR